MDMDLGKNKIIVCCQCKCETQIRLSTNAANYGLYDLKDLICFDCIAVCLAQAPDNPYLDI